MDRRKLPGREQRLTLLEPTGGGYWIASCSCGHRLTVIASEVRRGNTRSCGCLDRELNQAGRRPIKIALPKMRYGSWTVEAEAERDTNGKRRVRARCDCGTVAVVRANSLSTGNLTKCERCRRQAPASA